LHSLQPATGAHALAVGQDLGAEAARAVIDREAVAHAVQRVGQPTHLVLELRKRLDGEDLVVEDDRELAKRLLARPEVEAGRLRHVLVRLEDGVVVERVQWEVAPARPGDQRRELGVHDLAIMADVEDRQPFEAVTGRIDRVVVDLRVAGGQRANGRPVELVARELAAVPLGAGRLDDHGAEQAHGERAAVALAAGGRRRAVEQVRGLLVGIDRVGRALAGRHQAARVGSDIGAVVRARAVDVGQAHDVDRGGAGRRLLVVLRHGRQQILEVDREALALIDPQDQRPHALVLAQGDVAGRERAAFRLGPAGRIHHVAPQGEDHAARVVGAVAVVEEQLIERDDVGRYGVRGAATRCRLSQQRLGGERREQGAREGRSQDPAGASG
jgi:hypothetical protein